MLRARNRSARSLEGGQSTQIPAHFQRPKRLRYRALAMLADPLPPPHLSLCFRAPRKYMKQLRSEGLTCKPIFRENSTSTDVLSAQVSLVTADGQTLYAKQVAYCSLAPTPDSSCSTPPMTHVEGDKVVLLPLYTAHDQPSEWAALLSSSATSSDFPSNTVSFLYKHPELRLYGEPTLYVALVRSQSSDFVAPVSFEVRTGAPYVPPPTPASFSARTDALPFAPLPQLLHTLDQVTRDTTRVAVKRPDLEASVDATLNEADKLVKKKKWREASSAIASAVRLLVSHGVQDDSIRSIAADICFAMSDLLRRVPDHAMSLWFPAAHQRVLFWASYGAQFAYQFDSATWLSPEHAWAAALGFLHSGEFQSARAVFHTLSFLWPGDLNMAALEAFCLYKLGFSHQASALMRHVWCLAHAPGYPENHQPNREFVPDGAEAFVFQSDWTKLVPIQVSSQLVDAHLSSNPTPLGSAIVAADTSMDADAPAASPDTTSAPIVLASGTPSEADGDRTNAPKASAAIDSSASVDFFHIPSSVLVAAITPEEQQLGMHDLPPLPQTFAMEAFHMLMSGSLPPVTTSEQPSSPPLESAGFCNTSLEGTSSSSNGSEANREPPPVSIRKRERPRKDPQAPPKPRGRPRKVPLEAPAGTDAPPKKKRGRPKKQTVLDLLVAYSRANQLVTQAPPACESQPAASTLARNEPPSADKPPPGPSGVSSLEQAPARSLPPLLECSAAQASVPDAQASVPDAQASAQAPASPRLPAALQTIAFPPPLVSDQAPICTQSAALPQASAFPPVVASSAHVPDSPPLPVLVEVAIQPPVPILPQLPAWMQAPDAQSVHAPANVPLPTPEPMRVDSSQEPEIGVPRPESSLQQIISAMDQNVSSLRNLMVAIHNLPVLEKLDPPVLPPAAVVPRAPAPLVAPTGPDSLDDTLPDERALQTPHDALEGVELPDLTDLLHKTLPPASTTRPLHTLSQGALQIVKGKLPSLDDAIFPNKLVTESDIYPLLASFEVSHQQHVNRVLDYLNGTLACRQQLCAFAESQIERVQLPSSDPRGPYGVVAKHDIKRLGLLLPIPLYVCTDHEYDSNMDDFNRFNTLEPYAMDLKKNHRNSVGLLGIMTEGHCNVSRYINDYRKFSENGMLADLENLDETQHDIEQHSDDVNCRFMELYVHRGNYPFVFIVNTKPIAKGQELLVDYGWNYWKMMAKSIRNHQNLCRLLKHVAQRSAANERKRLREDNQLRAEASPKRRLLSVHA